MIEKIGIIVKIITIITIFTIFSIVNKNVIILAI